MKSVSEVMVGREDFEGKAWVLPPLLLCDTRVKNVAYSLDPCSKMVLYKC